MVRFLSRNSFSKTGSGAFFKDTFPARWKKIGESLRGLIERFISRAEGGGSRKRGVTGMEQFKWIAVDAETDEVVARGNSIAEAAENAKKKGFDDPVVTRALPEGQDMFF